MARSVISLAPVINKARRYFGRAHQVSIISTAERIAFAEKQRRRPYFHHQQFAVSCKETETDYGCILRDRGT